MKIPKFLYHATFEPYMKEISKNGLTGIGIKKTWSFSKDGVVYLSLSPENAFSYAETSDEISQDYLEQIVVLEIDTKNLDPNKFQIDRNNHDSDTLEYHGVIPPTNLFRMKGQF